MSKVQRVQAGGEGSEQVRAVEAEAVDGAAGALGTQLIHLKTLALPFVPQTHNTVVGGATGHQVVPISLQAEECAVVRLLPLHHALPGGETEVPQADEGVVATRQELKRRLKDNIQHSCTSPKV